MKKRIYLLIATFLGSGFSKIAPGTMGSLTTIPLAFILAYFYGLIGIILGVITSFAIGVFVIKEILKNTPHDPGFIVIDETSGQLLTFAAVANFLQYNQHAWLVYITGFILFRIFDITKPQPVRWADRKILNAWGVMLDDIIAGCYAMLILYILHKFGIISRF